MNDLNKILLAAFNDCKDLTGGQLASYIPELAKISPELFAISITTTTGENFSIGDTKQLFTLQSTSKPFSYGMALIDHGPEYVHSKIGVEPTGEAFNSIIELEKETHRPFNPMINSGAIAISNMIKSKDNINAFDRTLKLFSRLAARNLDFNESVFESEKKSAHRNRAIANLLRHFDVIDDSIEETLDLYFKLCSINVNILDLSVMAATLANHGINPITKEQVFTKNQCLRMTSLMFTCGMYDTSGTWAYSVGIPAKSGVSGAIFSVIPNKFSIACYSPLIDTHGHSIKGVAALKQIANSMDVNIFN